MTSSALEFLLAPVPDDPTSLGMRREPGDSDASATPLSIEDTALIGRVRSGDQAALEALHVTYWTALVRYAERLTRSAEEAQDLVQDVFLDLWALRDAWTVRGSIATYLYAAVRGRGLRVLRHERVVTRYSPDVAEEPFAAGGRFGIGSPTDDLEVAQLLSIVDRVLATCPPRCREAFILYRDHGLDLAEVARVMETSVGTVKVQVRRAVAALRRELGPHLEA